MKLYHYCKLDKWAFLNLDKQQVFASVLDKVNDPYEVSYQIDILPELKRPYIELMFGDNYNHGEHSYDRLINHALKENKKETTKNNGLVCFSEVYDSLPMWGHYADNQRGICLEFDTSYHPFNLALKVNYNKVPPIIPIHCVEHISEDYLSGFGDKIITTKSEQWKYEQEWRLLFTKMSPIKYEAKALLKLLFGFHTPLNDVLKVYNLTKSNKALRYYRQLLDDKNYQIVFEELTRDYMDSLETDCDKYK